MRIKYTSDLFNVHFSVHIFIHFAPCEFIGVTPGGARGSSDYRRYIGLQRQWASRGDCRRMHGKA